MSKILTPEEIADFGIYIPIGKITTHKKQELLDSVCKDLTEVLKDKIILANNAIEAHKNKIDDDILTTGTIWIIKNQNKFKL